VVDGSGGGGAALLLRHIFCLDVELASLWLLKEASILVGGALANRASADLSCSLRDAAMRALLRQDAAVLDLRSLVAGTIAEQHARLDADVDEVRSPHWSCSVAPMIASYQRTYCARVTQSTSLHMWNCAPRRVGGGSAQLVAAALVAPQQALASAAAVSAKLAVVGAASPRLLALLLVPLPLTALGKAALVRAMARVWARQRRLAEVGRGVGSFHAGCRRQRSVYADYQRPFIPC
jgi:hypothetical protein